MTELKTLLELERIVADEVGFDQKAIMVLKGSGEGNFIAIVTGPTSWLTKAAAQLEVNKVCAKLRLIYRVKD